MNFNCDAIHFNLIIIFAYSQNITFITGNIVDDFDLTDLS
jgi:hypothetical protein